MGGTSGESLGEKDAFSHAEDYLKIKIPESLKNILVINGYEEGPVIAKIDDTIISEMELFVQTDLKDIIDESEYPKYFGLFAKNPKMFRFVSGHRQILQILSAFFREKCLNNSPNSFTSSETLSRSSSKKIETTKKKWVPQILH